MCSQRLLAEKHVISNSAQRILPSPVACLMSIMAIWEVGCVGGRWEVGMCGWEAWQAR